MSSNPLQDNGLPKYDWFERIVGPIVSLSRSGKIRWDNRHGLTSYPHWLKKAIRREIVRVAKAHNAREMARLNRRIAELENEAEKNAAGVLALGLSAHELVASVKRYAAGPWREDIKNAPRGAPFLLWNKRRYEHKTPPVVKYPTMVFEADGQIHATHWAEIHPPKGAQDAEEKDA